MLLRSRVVNPILIAACAVIFLSSATFCSADDSFQPAPLPTGIAILDEGTPVKLILDQTLKSGACKVGDLVEYHVESDLYTSDRQLVVLAGSRAYGRVLTSKRHSYLGIPGKLDIGVTYILTPDKTKIPMRGSRTGGKGKDQLGGTVAATVIVGLPGLLIKGADKSLVKGTEVTSYVAEDKELMPYVTLIGHTGPAFDPLGPVENLYKLNDGTQVIGVQNAFDGVKYSVTTDSGLQLIDSTNVKSIVHIASPAMPVVH